MIRWIIKQGKEWSREATPDIGEYGEPEVLFSFGPVPDME